jgi:hypothetical protein
MPGFAMILATGFKGLCSTEEVERGIGGNRGGVGRGVN